MGIKAEFHYESDEVTIHIRIPLEDYQKLRQYQSQYPRAILKRLDGEYPPLNEIAETQRITLKEDKRLNMLRFLDRHLTSLCESEARLYGKIVEKAQTIQEALELSVNLDCYQRIGTGEVQQIKAHGYLYQEGDALPPVGMTGGYQVMARLETERGGAWLFLPLTEEKKQSMEKRLGVECLEERRAEIFRLKEETLAEYLPGSGTVKELKQFAQALEERENYQRADWDRVYASLLLEQPENFREVCEVLEKSASYQLLPEQTKPAQYQTPFGYLDLNGAVPLHPLSEELVTSWIYGRLYGELLEASYEMEESYVESLDGKGLTCYEDEIQARIEQEQAYGRENGGLAQYLHNVLLREKVCDIEVGVVVIAGELWSKTKIESYGALSETQTEALKAYLSGQFSDGWGEGVAQREIDIGDAELYLYFWHPELEDTLYTEEELEKTLEMDPTMLFS